MSPLQSAATLTPSLFPWCLQIIPANISPMARLWSCWRRIDYWLQADPFCGCKSFLCIILPVIWSFLCLHWQWKKKISNIAQMVLYAGWFLSRHYLNGYSTLNVISAFGGGGEQDFVSDTCALHNNQGTVGCIYSTPSYIPSHPQLHA